MVLVVTSEFVKLAQNLGRIRGHPNLPMVVLPHPFETLPADTIRHLADEKWEEIAQALANGG